jgi:hypothetical protein
MVVGIRGLKWDLLKNPMQAIPSHGTPGEIGKGPLLWPKLRSSETALLSSGVRVSTLFMHDRIHRR